MRIVLDCCEGGDNGIEEVFDSSSLYSWMYERRAEEVNENCKNALLATIDGVSDS